MDRIQGLESMGRLTGMRRGAGAVRAFLHFKAALSQIGGW
jgi:hypothetical protein